jgi:8-amino-7-oxononanoate synthase
MHPRDRIEYRTAALKGAGLWREPAAGEFERAEAGFVDARSNDYLGLAPRSVSRETTGTVGAGASRLISGTHPEHRQLELELAAWLGFEDCLLFSSGYAANVGAISALAGPGETILSDSLNHASIIDGCRLSRAQTIVLPHRDVEALDRALAAGHGVRWVVTESYFGMDGDSPDLGALRRVCDTHGAALLVDEAHAIGVFGAQGRGLCAALDARPDLLVGGMGKALGVHGGFVACSKVYREWLWNRARSFVFSTAPSPLLCSLALDRVGQVRGAEPERARLRELERRLAAQLTAAGVETPPGRHGPLFPIVLGTENAVLSGARRARDLGVLCHPIRPPTVPRGASRLRVTLRADMSDDDVDTLAKALVSAWAERKFDADSPVAFDGRLGPQGGDAVPASSSTEAATAELDNATVLEADGEAARVEQRRERSAGAPAPADRRSPYQGRGPAAYDGRSAPAALAPARAAREITDRADARGEWTLGERTPSRRWVVLGTGTGVGKTFVAQALVRALAATNAPVAGLKPVETGLTPGIAGDADTLGALAFHVKLPSPHPLYGFADPVTPSRAARAQGVAIDLDHIAHWIRSAVATTERASHLVIETAGAVFSPLSDEQTNFDLSIALDPATWLLVAPNRLGVLHDVTSALLAMTALGRRPDWIILSAPDAPDTSTSSNRNELSRLQSMPPIIELPRNDARPLEALLQTPLAESDR